MDTDRRSLSSRAQAQLDQRAGIVRVLWKIVGSIIAVGTIGFGSVQVVSALAHEENTTVRTFDDPGITTLDLDSHAGSVRIVGADRDTITVTSEVSDGLFPTDHTHAVEGDRLVLRTKCPPVVGHFCSVDYTIEVPADLTVVAHVDNGSATVTGIDGPVDVSADNGGVDLDGLTGRVQADSDNGSVEGVNLRSTQVDATSDNGSVRLSFVVEPEAVVAETDHGSVEIVVPDTSVAYRVDLSSGDGSTDAAVRTDPNGARTLTGRSDTGSVTARYSG
jgi:hypothetical protein